MSYAISAALQELVFAALSGNTVVTSLVGGNIFDAAPSGTLPEIYVVIGDERVRDRSDQSGQGASHDLAIIIHSSQAGFQGAKALAAAICDALLAPIGALTRGQLVNMTFLRANARRDDSGTTRRIDLIFRARVSDE